MIKSLDELRKIREKHLEQVALREGGKTSGNRVEVLVGMSTCGISSGARETLNQFIEEISKQGLEHIKVIPVGCIGYCHSEPTVQVNIANQSPVLYGNVKADQVHEIIEQHIKEGKPVERLLLKADFERA